MDYSRAVQSADEWYDGLHRGEPKAVAAADRLLADMARMWPREELSARELEVLTELANGGTFAEVGSRMLLSSETVKSHLRNIRAILGASNTTAAVAKALREGLIS